MAIPPFDHNKVIPPHLGNPTVKTDLSPYDCSIIELSNKFSTSKERINILKNFIAFRQKMNVNGIINGFQWIDGSFIEDVENLENRPPADIDVVTFFIGLSKNHQFQILQNFPEFASSVLAKRNFKVDHYPVDYGHNPKATVESTRYWIQLFSHNRNGVWKGILKLPLNTPKEDQDALDFLNSLIQ